MSKRWLLNLDGMSALIFPDIRFWSNFDNIMRPSS